MDHAQKFSDAAAEIWAANPHLSLTFADFGAFAQAHAVHRKESAEKFAGFCNVVDDGHADSRALADVRLQQIRSPGLSIPNAAAVDRCGARLTIWVYGPIGTGPLQAGPICDALEANHDAQAIIVRIASAGGLVRDSHAIANALLRHPARSVAIIDSFAYSGASLVASACNRVLIRRASSWMAHSSLSAADGNAAQLQAKAAELQSIDCRMTNLYATRRRMSLDTAREMLRAGEFLSAPQALAIGAADRILGDLPTMEASP